MITYKCNIFYFNTRRPSYEYGMAPPMTIDSTSSSVID